jgi:hypothetical protein
MIEQVIAGRRKSARCFSTQAFPTDDSNLEESNNGHQYFIEVLEQLRDTLVNLQEPIARPAAKKAAEDQKDPIDEIKNIFALLEIEPDTEHTLTEPKARAHKPRKSDFNVEFEQARSAEEGLWSSEYYQPSSLWFKSSQDLCLQFSKFNKDTTNYIS